MIGSKLHFTIGTGLRFDSDDRFNVTEELAMVKAALLYADHATLCSPGISMLTQFYGLQELTTVEERRNYLADYHTARILTDPHAEILTIMPKLRMLMKSESDRAKRARIVRGTVARRLPSSRLGDDEWDELAAYASELPSSLGLDEIIEAQNTGLLDLHTFKADAGAGWVDASSERVKAKTFEFLDLIAGAMTSASSYPVLDDQAGELARMLSNSGAAVPNELHEARGKHAALATDLMRELPDFEGASVKEILDIRRELEGPLVQFRSAVVEWSREFSSLGWDPRFPLEVNQLFIEKIAPAVKDMREAVEENSELKSLALKGVRPGAMLGGLVAMATIGAFLSPVVGVAVGSFLTAGVIGRQAYEEWRNESNELEGNRLYFYYDAGRRLSGT